MAKIQPAVQTITLGTGTVAGGSTGIRYVDLSQIASIVNRRFYRQGLNWAVGGFKITTSGSANTGSIIALKIQETWVTSGSWEKSMRHWLKQQNDAIREMGAESTVARYRDFKVFMDTNHVNAFKAAGNDLNISNDIPPGFAVGEWQPSQVVIPNDGAPGVTGEYYVKFYGGSDADAKDMVGGYAFSRALPTSPDPETLAVETSWLNLMQDVGNNSDEIVDNATDTNDELPYNQAQYPGFAPNADAMAIHDKNSLTTTTVGGATYLKGGMFPCGLIQFQVSNSGSEVLTYDIQIDLVPGHHRGYLCQPMTEM
jgi:hypothetical protein